MRASAEGFSGRGALAGYLLLAAGCGTAIALADVNALILCAAALGCMAILRDFRIGVVLLLLLMPLSRSAMFPHAMLGITGLNPFNLLLVATLGACLLQRPSGGLRHFLPPRLTWLYLVPMLAAGALGSRHVDEIAPVYRVMDMIEFNSAGGYLVELLAKPLLLVVFGLLVGAAVVRSIRPERLLGPALASLWAMCAIVVFYVIQSGISLQSLASSDSREFLSAIGMHANDLGRLFAFACTLLLFVSAEVKGAGLKTLLIATLGLGLAAMVLTFSRGAFVAFLISGLLFLLWRRSAAVLVLVLLAGAGAAMFLPSAVYDRVQMGFGAGMNAVSAGRIEGLWLPLLPEFLASPVYGNGLGSILWSAAMRSGNPDIVLGAVTPHNAYLQALLDMGIVGLILLCAYFAHVWRGFRQLGTDAAMSPMLRGFFQGAAAGLAGYLVAGAAGGSLTPNGEQCYLWLAVGMMYGLRARAAGGAKAGGAKA
jgi:hypothetical protein